MLSAGRPSRPCGGVCAAVALRLHPHDDVSRGHVDNIGAAFVASGRPPSVGYQPETWPIHGLKIAAQKKIAPEPLGPGQVEQGGFTSGRRRARRPSIQAGKPGDHAASQHSCTIHRTAPGGSPCPNWQFRHAFFAWLGKSLLKSRGSSARRLFSRPLESGSRGAR